MLSSDQRPMISSKELHTSSTTPSRSATNRQTEIQYTRRQFLRAGIAIAIALPILYFGLGSLISPRQEVQQSASSLLSQFRRRSAESKPVGFENPRLPPLLASEITPTELFYRIGKNPIVSICNGKYLETNCKRIGYKAYTNELYGAHKYVFNRRI